MTFARLFALTVVTVGTLINASPAHSRALDPISNDEMNLRLAELQHLPFTGLAPERAEGWLSSCRRSVVTITVGDPRTGTIRQQALTVVRPDTTKRVPAMIVIPTMEGVTVVERSVAVQFCDIGIATIIADVNNNRIPEILPSWGLEDVNNRNAIMAVRSAIDFAQTSAYFDSTRVGLMGLSLGAITSSFMAGIEQDRLAAVVLVLAGGNLPYILSVSDNDRVRELRDQRMERERIQTPGDYESILRQHMRYDPFHFASRALKEKMFMVLSESDDKVPTPMQKELFELYGRPSSTVFKTGHVQTILSLTYFYFDSITNFVEASFGMRPSFGPTHTVIENPRIQ